jgi:hypothetical protein
VRTGERALQAQADALEALDVAGDQGSGAYGRHFLQWQHAQMRSRVRIFGRELKHSRVLPLCEGSCSVAPSVSSNSASDVVYTTTGVYGTARRQTIASLNVRHGRIQGSELKRVTAQLLLERKSQTRVARLCGTLSFCPARITARTVATCKLYEPRPVRLPLRTGRFATAKRYPVTREARERVPRSRLRAPGGCRRWPDTLLPKAQ